MTAGLKGIVFLTLLTVKAFSVIYLAYLGKCSSNAPFYGIACMAGDTESYLAPIENYIEEGSYYYKTAKAGRMPYYGLIYFPFRVLFSKTIALNILVVLQIAVDALAMYYLALLCEKIFGKKGFVLFILLACVSLNVTSYDYYLIPETFGIGFSCIFSYQYYIYLSSNRTKKQLLIAGTFLGLAVLFKPYLSLLYGIIVAELFLYFIKKGNFVVSIKKTAAHGILFVIPLLMLNLPWTVRNYIIFKQFIPFQQNIYAGYDYTNANLSVRKFIQSIGESFIFWDKYSAGCYFEPRENLPCEYKIPQRILGPNLTIEKIEKAREVYLQYQKTPNDSLERIVVQKFDELTQMYKKDHPVFSTLGVPLMLIKKFLIHSGSYYLPIRKDFKCYKSYQFYLKISQSLLYYLCLTFGWLGTIVLLYKHRESFIIFTFPVFLCLLFPVFLRLTEYRYFHMAYPYLLVGLVQMFLLTVKFFEKELNRGQRTNFA
ncbi:MAG: glycosyltransferase family 39 protein [Bacteroidia bacterium]|nr:glycosyltransferase family 39 protein [Bacteroidia bacterium]